MIHFGYQNTGAEPMLGCQQLILLLQSQLMYERETKEISVSRN